MPEDRKSAAAILDRIQEALGLKSDGDISRVLGIGRSTVGGWRAQNRKPYELCVGLCEDRGISLDWLLTGEGEMLRRTGSADAYPAGPDGVSALAVAEPAPPAAVRDPAALPPTGKVGLAKRIEALSGLLEALQPGDSDAILADALSRAALAQRVGELDQAVRDLRETEAKKRA